MSDYFVVERSKDGSAFKAVSSNIAGAGTSSQAHEYSVADLSAPVGRLYYRLKQVDVDGTTAYSEVCSLENGGDVLNIPHPNPSSGTVSIDFDSDSAFALNIINGLGQKVSAPMTVTDKGLDVNASSLPSGVYIFEFLHGGKLVRSRVVIAH